MNNRREEDEDDLDDDTGDSEEPTQKKKRKKLNFGKQKSNGAWSMPKKMFAAGIATGAIGLAILSAGWRSITRRDHYGE